MKTSSLGNVAGPLALAMVLALGMTLLWPSAEAVADDSVPPTTPVATSTTLSVAPPQPILLGDTVTLTAQITSDPNAGSLTGEVEFFVTLASTGVRQSLGIRSIDVTGSAVLETTSLLAGGHTFSADFTPDDPFTFASSHQATSANYGVVDISAPTPYVPGPGAHISTGATATWGWSDYSLLWTRVASGDIEIEPYGPVFEFSNGVVNADADGATISFTGTMRVQAYEGFFPLNGIWIELYDPTLHLTSDGTGVWVAGVASGSGAYIAQPDAPRLVVGVVSGYTGGGIGVDGERAVSLAFTGTTAPGTWSVSGGVPHAGGWPNAFVWQVVLDNSILLLSLWSGWRR